MATSVEKPRSNGSSKSKLAELKRNDYESLQMIMELVDKLEKSGLNDILGKVLQKFTPTDLEYLFDFITSETILESVIKDGNLLLILIRALASDVSQDLVSGILANQNYIIQQASDLANEPHDMNATKLYRLIKDKDVMYSLSFFLGIAKGTGRVISDYYKEKNNGKK
ncbi:MAG: DUF1641 domain-containing protein [Thermoplasmata archaeon]